MKQRSASSRPCGNRPRGSAHALRHMQVSCQIRKAHESGNSRTNREEVPRRWSDSLQLRLGGWSDSPQWVERFAPGPCGQYGCRYSAPSPVPATRSPQSVRVQRTRPIEPDPLMAAGGGEPIFRSPRHRWSMSWRWRSNRASSRGRTSRSRDVARRWSCPHNSSTEPASAGCRRG